MTNLPSINTDGNVLECCGQIFFSRADLNAHKAAVHREQQKAVATKIPDPTPAQLPITVKIPILLTYQYTGTCDCGTNVETLNLDDPHTSSKQALIAWCPICKKQLQTKTVNKIK